MDFLVRRTAPSGVSFAGAAPGFGPDDTLLWVFLSNVFARQCSASIANEWPVPAKTSVPVRCQRLLGRLRSPVLEDQVRRERTADLRERRSGDRRAGGPPVVEVSWIVAVTPVALSETVD